MRPEITFKHEFVEFIPSELAEGTLYISIRFGTVQHLCACGCKSKVVTPLRPTDWKLIYDGKTVSLDPSIGNWSYACRSHYWIRNNKVRWAKPWSQTEIEAGRAQDRLAKDRYYGQLEESPAPKKAEPQVASHPKSIWQKIWDWLGS